MQPEHDNDVKVEYRGTGFYVSLAIIFLGALTLLILAVQNTSEVTIEILGWEFDLPLFGVILGTALVAVVLDELIGLVWRRQRRTRLEERAELQRLRAEREGRAKAAADEEEEVAELPNRHLDGPDEPPASDPNDPFRPDERNSPT